MNYIAKNLSILRYGFPALSLLFHSFYQSSEVIYIFYLFLLFSIFFEKLNNNIKLLIFLLPCLGYAPLVDSGSNPITMFYLLVFLKYIILKAPNKAFKVKPVICAFLLITLELINFYIYKQTSVLEFFRWAALLFFAVLLIAERDSVVDFNFIYSPFIYGYLTSAIAGLFYYISLKNHVATHEVDGMIARFSGLAGDPNNFGLYAILAIIFTLYKLSKTDSRLVYRLLIVFFIITGMLTVSRTFTIVFILISFLYFLFIPIYKNSTIVVFSLFLLVIFSLFFNFDFNINIVDHIIERFSFSEIGNLTGGRSYIFSSYIDKFSGLNAYQQLTGVGVLNYLEYYHQLSPSDFIPKSNALVGPHNTFIEALISFGILGSMILLGLLISLFYPSGYKIHYNKESLFFIFSVLVCIILFSMSLQNLAKYNFYFLLVLIVSFQRMVFKPQVKL